MLTLSTRHGDLDIVQCPAGSDGYADLRQRASHTAVPGTRRKVLVISSDDILHSKTEADRPKDREQLPNMRRDLEGPAAAERDPPDRDS